ncbi:MAG: GTP-binding protein [Candidatus Pacebacteria bacterium]|nr:GTP-binding protein [Candidatus Paceibacterota bacterium]
MNKSKIRNFSIIAHIDHGKSTLADRMIEITKTIEKRKMKAQVLDNMELERERGITIKMQPVTMKYIFKNEEYILNLIDTPGHIDFYYEVSRAMHAVEGTILLVDATQGIQAQTLTTLRMAQKANLKIIPALSKTDSPLSRPEEIAEELAILLDCDTSEILKTSSRTGEGVEELLQKIINDIPAPQSTFQNSNDFRALIFDFKYHKNRGIIVFVRVLDGQIKKRDTLKFKIAKEKFQILELGIISPEETPQESLSAGQIGYIVTGIKKPGVVSVGDTLVNIRFDLPA